MKICEILSLSRRFTVRKVSCGDKIKDVASPPCASTSEGSKAQQIQRALWSDRDVNHR